MPAINWETAIKYAQLVKIAESVEPSAEYSDQNKADIEALGYNFLQTIYGNELATDVSPHEGQTVTYGFLGIAASRSGELVAIVRGTSTILEWIHDASFLLVPNPIHSGSGLTEDGFTSIYKSLRIGRDAQSATAVASIGSYLNLKQAKTVTVSGHSLGGALATLLVYDVALNTPDRNPTVYSFASPRTGDHLFAGSFNAVVSNSYRVYNRADLVPNLPPILPLPYEHVNFPFELIAPHDAIKTDIVCAHHITTYLWLLAEKAGTNTTFPIDSDCRGSAYPGPPVPAAAAPKTTP